LICYLFDLIVVNKIDLSIKGSPMVGKTSIINWFLSREYRDSYIPTIEDFHRKIYKIKGEVYRLDILDTSGNDPFPAMKKLNIMTSN
jgi:RAS, dexamethasone-induced Ras-related protein 1